jgi:hypothetical protein
VHTVIVTQLIFGGVGGVLLRLQLALRVEGYGGGDTVDGAGADDAVIAELRSLWLEGAAAERPVAAMTSSLGIKWQFAELSNVLYCLQLGIWEGAGAYLYDTFSGRAVAVPADLAAKLTAAK